MEFDLRSNDDEVLGVAVSQPLGPFRGAIRELFDGRDLKQISLRELRQESEASWKIRSLAQLAELKQQCGEDTIRIGQVSFDRLAHLNLSGADIYKSVSNLDADKFCVQLILVPPAFDLEQFALASWYTIVGGPGRKAPGIVGYLECKICLNRDSDGNISHQSIDIENLQSGFKLGNNKELSRIFYKFYRDWRTDLLEAASTLISERPIDKIRYQVTMEYISSNIERRGVFKQFVAWSLSKGLRMSQEREKPSPENIFDNYKLYRVFER